MAYFTDYSGVMISFFLIILFLNSITVTIGAVSAHKNNDNDTRNWSGVIATINWILFLFIMFIALVTGFYNSNNLTLSLGFNRTYSYA